MLEKVRKFLSMEKGFGHKQKLLTNKVPTMNKEIRVEVVNFRALFTFILRRVLQVSVSVASLSRKKI